MNEDKRNNKLMKQGRGLAAASIILIILALVLGAVLIDASFVPEGEMWEQCRESMRSYFLDYDPTDEAARYSDKEMWERIKTEMKEVGMVPVKSGYLCWNIIVWERNAEAIRLSEREDLLTLSQETAEKTMEIFSGFLSEKGIYVQIPQTVQIKPWNGNIELFSSQLFSAEEEAELCKRLSEVYPDKKEWIAEVFVTEERCTAAVYAPNVSNIYDGVDYPYYDDNGCFDEERTWGFGFSEVHKNGFIIGYIDENGVRAYDKT